MLIKIILSCLLYSFVSIFSYSADFKDFDDSIQFRLNWPGKSEFGSLNGNEISEFMVVTTTEKEKYNCSLPQNKKKNEKETEDEYVGPNALELLQPLFQSSSCYSRIESYWTYEVCHERFIRQYHEEKDGKKSKLQEYFLGRWDKKMTNQLSEELDKQQKEGVQAKTKKIDGVSVPYLELNFTDGTICDLNGEPRQTKVHYMCLNNTRSDVLSVKEVATCSYEVYIFTQLICKHPKYRPAWSGSQDINCYPVGDVIGKPKKLMDIEMDSIKKRLFKPPSGKNEKMYAVYTIDDIDSQDGRMKVKLEFHTIDSTINSNSNINKKLNAADKEWGANRANAPDTLPFASQEFLSGKHCLRGGSGWWKYKFCYGVSVEQYHVEKKLDGNIEMTSILLGVFNKDAHIEWITKNPQKKPKPIGERTTFSQYYTEGDICEKTGKKRETEVRLKCVDRKASVTLYLLEPKVCHYILGVESPIICDIIDRVNDQGLIDKSQITSFSKNLFSDP